MSEQAPSLGLLGALKLRWYGLLQKILGTWVRTRTLPKPISDLSIDPSKPVCYALDSYALTSILILDQSCQEWGLPRPLLPLQMDESSEPRAYCIMRRKSGLLVQRTKPRKHSETLKRLVDGVCKGDVPEVQVVPVTVLIGRAPDKETGLAKIFFSESWDIGGRLRRFFGTLVNGRNTFVQFSQPLSLRSMADEGLGEARTLRKVSRILRVHFSNVRAAAIGPDLSHRRTVIDGILLSPSVERVIEDQARVQAGILPRW